MARYTFSLDSYDIRNTRSRHEDTNYVTVGLMVNGVSVGTPQTKFMGDQNNGSFPVGLAFTDVEVPEGATVIFNYQILNCGHKSRSEVEEGLRGAAVQQLSKADATPAMADPDKEQGNENPWARAAKEVFEAIVGLIFANCDGLVASRPLKFTSDELKQIPPGQTRKDSQAEHGSDSASGCGSNSDYAVRWSITAA